MIKEYRQAAGLTQKQFAELFDISIDTAKAWDCGRRKPTKVEEKLIIKELKAMIGGGSMNIFSEHYKMAAMDVSSNGYEILSRDKYKKIIKTTEIKRFGNGAGRIEWKDKDGLLVCDHVGFLDDSFPKVGEVIEI